jgi:Protein of unknown function (DUF3828)
MTTLKGMVSRNVLCLSLVLCSAVCFGDNSKRSTAEEFIRALYRFYQPWKEHSYWLDNKEMLSKYFDKELTALFLKDDECTKREQGVCNLDFDPIYDAQDFDKETKDLKIVSVSGQPNVFNVTFTNLGTRTLIYNLKKTPKGWRISDIKYSEGPSLEEILSREVE